MSTASPAANPAPATVTIVPGGPLSADGTMPGQTVNASRLAAVPLWPVRVTGPVEAPAGPDLAQVRAHQHVPQSSDS